MTDDLLKRAEPFLNQCGSCDLGLPYPCNCPTGDFRPVMSELAIEVQRLRREHEPRRGSDVEAWLQAFRDAISESDAPAARWAVDDLLSIYRDHADCGYLLTKSPLGPLPEDAP